VSQFQEHRNKEFRLQLDIDSHSILPAYAQIASALRAAILDCTLAEGDNMPSLAVLSKQLGVSRSTIAKAFDILASQGYITISQGSGAKVSRRYMGVLSTGQVSNDALLPADFSHKAELTSAFSTYSQSDPIKLSAYGRRLLKLSAESVYSESPELQTYSSGPDLELTPFSQWKSLLEQNCRKRDVSRLDYSHEPFGYPPLREAYAAYLIRARAVRCSSEQVVVFSARELKLDLICRMLIDPGDCVAVEDPGYPDVRQRFQAYGASLIAIPTDHDGLCVDKLESVHQKIKILYVSPSYVEPTGAVLSLERRHKLLEWARRNRTFIIEDDYASEYRYNGRPLPSLQGLDRSDLVIHLSCLWKVLFPVLRLGFLVIPRSLTEMFTLAKALNENDLPLFDQFALTDFINDGILERHIRKTRAIYARRREKLVDSLKRALGENIQISEEAAGFELLVKLKTKLKSQELLTLARLQKLPIFSSQPNYFNSVVDGEFILPFAQFDESCIDDYVAKLRALLA
jgi:GntR family transcriptional regulator / MocR family aminotransferase